MKTNMTAVSISSTVESSHWQLREASVVPSYRRSLRFAVASYIATSAVGRVARDPSGQLFACQDNNHTSSAHKNRREEFLMREV